MCCSYVHRESDKPAPPWRGNSKGDGTEALRYFESAQCGIVGEGQWEKFLQSCGAFVSVGRK